MSKLAVCITSRLTLLCKCRYVSQFSHSIFNYGGLHQQKTNQILVGYTAYNCRMVINKDDPSAIKDFSFISDGKPLSLKFNNTE